MTPREQEMLEVLAGARAKGANRRRQSVRIEDLAALLDLPPDLQSMTMTTTPTLAQYNALVSDLHAVHKRLRLISDALTAKLT